MNAARRLSAHVSFLNYNTGTDVQKLVSCPLFALRLRACSSHAYSEERYQVFLKTRKISKAMQAYMAATKSREDLLAKENAEFELGKRHLANMMSLDPDRMTQDDIDDAIRYLLPSGLFSPRSRPSMKPPSYHFTDVKPAEFSDDGRPYNDMFYTLKPKFYQHIYDVYEKVERLDEYEKRRQDTPEQQRKPENDISLALAGTKWLDVTHLQQKFLERIGEAEEKQFAVVMEHLVAHPLAYLERDFIASCRTSVGVAAAIFAEVVTETKTDEDGRVYTEADGRRKSCNAYVKVYSEGSGRFDIDGRDLLQFELPNARETLLHPFLILDRCGQFDVVARTEGGGASGRAGAVRTAVCKALGPFLSEKEIDQLRLAGLLSRDIRRKERHKFQHIGARTRPVWKRR